MPNLRLPRTVLLVFVSFKYDRDLAVREENAINGALRGLPYHRAGHSQRNLTWVVETDLKASELRERLRTVLEAGCIESARVFTPGSDFTCIDALDPLADAITTAWTRVREWNTGRRPHRPSKDQIFTRAGVAKDERQQAVRAALGLKKRATAA